jgi:EmrB/QacA subfamily drug resistance transporter
MLNRGMTVPDSPPVSPVPDRARRLLILGICSMSLLIVGLDITIVNVALPAIHRSLHASLSGLQWTIDAYTLVLASLLMLSGSTADRIGRRRVFQIGLATFSLGSLLCALAPSLPVLIGARVLQAIGGSMLNPVAMSIIRNVFTDPRERAQAIGVWGAMVGVSIAMGPVLGGVLVDTISWRAVFLVNFPIGVAAILLTARYVPESRAEHTRRIDPVGQLLIIIGLASLVYAIIEAPSAGWLSGQTLALGAVFVVALATLVGYERRVAEPLIEMRFFGSAPFSGASAIAIAVFAAQGGFLFLNTLYLQETRGLSPLDAGLCTLPMALALLVMAPLTGRFVGTHGARAPLVAGGLGLVAAGVMLTRVTDTTSYPYLLGAYLVFGLGLGVLNPPITNIAVSGMPASMAGVAAAIASTSRQFGSTIGVAVLGALAGGATTGSVAAGFAHATHVSWWIVVGMGGIVVMLGIITTTTWALGTARRTADSYRTDSDAEATQRARELVAH